MSAAELGLTSRGFVEDASLQRQPQMPPEQSEGLSRQPHALLLLLLSLESFSPEGQSGYLSVSDDNVRLAIAVEGRDPRQLIESLNEVAKMHEDVLPAPAPQALLVGVSEDSLSLSLRFWTMVGAQNIDRLKHQLRQQILVALTRSESPTG